MEDFIIVVTFAVFLSIYIPFTSHKKHDVTLVREWTVTVIALLCAAAVCGVLMFILDMNIYYHIEHV